MIRGDRRVDADLQPASLLAVNPADTTGSGLTTTSTRVLPLLATKSPRRDTRQGQNQPGNSLTTGEPSRPMSPQACDWSPDALPITTAGRTHAAPACQSSGAPPTQTTHYRAPQASHQFPQPGLLERRAPATISFTSPELTRKPSPPGSLSRGRLRDTTCCQEAPQ